MAGSPQKKGLKMKHPQSRSNSSGLSTALGILAQVSAVLALAFCATPAVAEDNRAPDVPCETIKVPEGNKVIFHTYALGAQIYRWDGSTWAFVAPAAVLFANADYDGEVGTHYGGPSWESNSGSKVVGRRIQGCTPDPSSIPWLLLEATATDGPGIFSHVTFIQRVNTVGGVAPAAPGASVGEMREVPYMAEYFFYRAAQE
jgi:hypothetical protein